MENKGYIQAAYDKIMSDLIWLKVASPWILFVLACTFIIFLILNPEKAKTIKAWVLSIVAVAGYFRKNYIGTKIESQIANGCKGLNNQIGQDFLNSNIEIKWVTKIDRDSFIKDDKIIIKLSYKDNPNSNFVNAVVTYLNKGFLSKARNYVAPSIIKSSELLIAKKLINNQCAPALSCFMEEVYDPLTKEKPELHQVIQDLNLLDNKGFFMQILLPELQYFGAQVYSTHFPTQLFHEETEKLLKFLLNVANKEQGVDISPEYQTHYFNFSIMLMAKKEKINIQGLRPYIEYVKIASLSFRKIYIIALGNQISHAKSLINKIIVLPEIVSFETKDTEVISGLRSMKGICFVVTTLQQIESRKDSA